VTISRINLLTTSALLGILSAMPATAQTTSVATDQAAAPQVAPETATAPEAAGNDQSDIMVTARRRDESIVDVPLAITVVSSKTLEKLDITSTEQLANFTPGLQFSDFTPGNSRNDRGGNRPLIFRGLNLSNNGGVTGAGSMFLDGAAVIGNEIPAGMDIGAVEVLRGPQNVYFGRASMTGAVSYRTKAIPDVWSEAFDLAVAERKTYRAEASVAGPLIPGLVGVRVTGLAEANDGFITNGFSPGGEKLGSRSRKSISGTVDFTPAKSLEVKLYANYFQDEDGMPATVNIFPDATVANGVVTSLGAVTNCLRGVAVGAGATQQARPTICGEVPGRGSAINYSNPRPCSRSPSCKAKASNRRPGCSATHSTRTP
jgi:iron complex outermembrane receptor protein